MRIGVIVPDERVNAYYRALMPTSELARRGHLVGTAFVSSEKMMPPIEAFGDFDLVHIWALYFPIFRRLAAHLQASGIAVTFDQDDDVSATPRGSREFRRVGGLNGQRAWAESRSMIRRVDAVTTPSAVLAERFRGVGQQHVHTIENHLPGVGAPRARRDAEILIGWVAAGEHQVDVKALRLKEAFQRLLELRPHVRVETVGVSVPLDSPRYRHVSRVPFSELPAQIGRFDLGIAPLTDSAFNRSRSNIKLKEYAAQGVPWLASPIGPYRELGAREGGRLVEEGRWLEAMLALVDDASERNTLGRQAHAWARQETVAANVGQWERIFESAVERARTRTG